jgi:hypothetical protein
MFKTVDTFVHNLPVTEARGDQAGQVRPVRQPLMTEQRAAQMLSRGGVSLLIQRLSSGIPHACPANGISHKTTTVRPWFTVLGGDQLRAGEGDRP